MLVGSRRRPAVACRSSGDQVPINRTNRRKTKRSRTVKLPRRNSTPAARHTGASVAGLTKKNALLTRQLNDALEQQTATADVLKVISREKFELQPILDVLVESAARLCEADMVAINRHDHGVYRQVAQYGQSPEFAAYMGKQTLQVGRGTVSGRVALEKKLVHVTDVLADREFKETAA